MKNFIFVLALVFGLFAVMAAQADAQTVVWDEPLPPGAVLVAIDGVPVAQCANGRCGAVRRLLAPITNVVPRVRNAFPIIDREPILRQRVTRTRIFWLR